MPLLFCIFFKHLMLKYTNYMTTSCGEQEKKGIQAVPELSINIFFFKSQIICISLQL